MGSSATCCSAAPDAAGHGMNSPAPHTVKRSPKKPDEPDEGDATAVADVDQVTVEAQPVAEVAADESADADDSAAADAEVSPALSLEPATPLPAPEPMPDTEQTAGTRVAVEGDGLGEGTYTDFKASWIGANVHTIAFDSGETKKMKLRDLTWRILSVPAEAEADAADDAPAAPEPPPVPITTPPVIPATPVAAEEDSDNTDGKFPAAEPMPDTELAAGIRIFVTSTIDGAVMGEGTYVRFSASWIGANIHTVQLDSGETKKLKLRDLTWRIVSVPESPVEMGTDLDANIEALENVATPEAPADDEVEPEVLPTAEEETATEDVEATATELASARHDEHTTKETAAAEDDAEEDTLDEKEAEKRLKAAEKALEADRKRKEAQAAADAKAVAKAEAVAAKVAARIEREVEKKEQALADKWSKLLTKLEIRETKAAAQRVADAAKKEKEEAKAEAAAAKEAARVEREQAKADAVEEKAVAKAAAVEAKREEKELQQAEKQAARALAIATKLANKSAAATASVAAKKEAEAEPEAENDEAAEAEVAEAVQEAVDAVGAEEDEMISAVMGKESGTPGPTEVVERAASTVGSPLAASA